MRWEQSSVTGWGEAGAACEAHTTWGFVDLSEFYLYSEGPRKPLVPGSSHHCLHPSRPAAFCLLGKLALPRGHTSFPAPLLFKMSALLLSPCHQLEAVPAFWLLPGSSINLGDFTTHLGLLVLNCFSRSILHTTSGCLDLAIIQNNIASVVINSGIPLLDAITPVPLYSFD